MTTDATARFREWAKQVAVWLAVTTLVPLTVWYGTAAVSSPPDEEEYQRQHTRLDSQITNGAKDQAVVDRLSAEREQLEKQHADAMKLFARHMFWVAYPIGLLAFAIGTVTAVQSVGAGLMFGGIAALTVGCYSAWEILGRWLHFGSLIVALAAILILGLWRFRRLGVVGAPNTSQNL